MAISEDFKKFVEKNLPSFKVVDETTPEQVEAEFGKSFVLEAIHKEEIGKAVGRNAVKHEVALKKVIGEAAKGKELEEMINTILPALIKEKQDEIVRLQEEMQGTGKTTEDFEKQKKLIEQLQADLNQANTDKASLTTEVEEWKKKPDEVLKQHIEKQKVEAIYKGAPWDDSADDFKKEGVWHKKIEGKVIPKMEEDGEVYAYEPDGETYMKDGTGKKKFSTFVEEVLKSDDVKAYKENGGTFKPHPDTKTLMVPVDKKLQHKENMQKIADEQRGK